MKQVKVIVGSDPVSFEEDINSFIETLKPSTFIIEPMVSRNHAFVVIIIYTLDK